MRTTILGLLATALLAALLGCGTQNIGAGGSPSRDTAAFKLNVLDDSFVGGASAAGFDLSVEDYGRDVMVSIKAEQAVDLKALYASLDYDPQQYRPLTAGPARSLPGTEHYLSLDVKSERGRMWYGQVLSNYEWRSGFSGDGVLATAVFRKEPTPLRSASTPPNTPASATVLSWDGTNLNWRYFSTGDYDQDSEVFISDLTPLGANLGETHTVADTSTGLSAIDGDQNGELNISDLTPLGANFGKTCSGYNVYSGVAAGDYPDGGTLVTNIAFTTATGGYGGDATAGTRKTLTHNPAIADFFWVRPTDGTTDGTPSNLLATNPADVPELILTNPPATGSGTALDPYIIDTSTDYVFQVNDTPGGTDVTNDPLTNWDNLDVNDDSTAGDNVFNLDDAYAAGMFSITVSYNSQTALPVMYFNVSSPGGGIVILPDPADADWTGVTGAGTSGDPYIVMDNMGTADTGDDFNGDYSVVFGLLAETSTGDPILVNEVTWAANPPFAAFFTTGPGLMTAGPFTNGYVVGTKDSDTSNSLYILGHNLPTS